MDLFNRRSFTDGVQTTWDATSIELFQACPRKYYYSIIESIQPRSQSVHLLFGGIYASALELFYSRRALGASIDEALIAAVRLAMVEGWNHERDDEGLRKQGTGQPLSFNHSAKTMPNLIRTLVWYVDQFGDEEHSSIKTHHLQNGKPATELSFVVEIAPGINYAGHLDRVVNWNESGLYWMDQKAQPLTSLILTPGGFVPLGALQPGQTVMGTDGETHTILDIHPKGKTSCYRITTNDGVSTLAAGEHLWTVRKPAGKWQTLTTPELIGQKWELPTLSPMKFPEADLPLHPYAFGLLLGDGYFGGHSVQFSDLDGKEASILAQLVLPDSMKPASIHNNSWTISGGVTLEALRNLGLWQKLSAGKFIPDCYLYASIQQRAALLKGLLDTDGCRNSNSQLYDTMSEQLAKDICQLARSLGNTARYRARGDGAFRATIYGPSVGHKQRNPRIIAVEQVEDTKTACLEVSASNHLYITDNYIPTHNTTGSTVSPAFFEGFKPSNQFLGYTWAGQIVLESPILGGIIDAAQIAVGFSRFERQQITFTSEQLEEWHSNTLWTIEQAQSATALGHFPMNLSSCGNYGGCAFRPLCSRTPRIRPTFIRGDYVVREKAWDPATPR